MKIRILLFLIVGILLIAGCSDDPTLKGINLKMKAETNLSTINGRTDGSELVFTQVLIGVRELEFETEEEDEAEDNNGHEDDSDEIEFEGPYRVNLIDGTSSPSFDLGSVTPGVYDKIEIEMGPVLENGNTIFIAFTHNLVPVEFSTRAELEVEIEKAGGFELDVNTLKNLLVILNLDELFANLDLSQADVDEDGVIRINDTSNTNIIEQVLSNFDHSFEAGDDDDHDDEIDDD